MLPGLTILAIGSRGNVEPYVALATGIQTAGHEVRLATHVTFEGLVRTHGLELFPVTSDPHGTLEGEAGREWTKAGTDFLSFIKRTLSASGSSLFDMLTGFWKACHETDLIIFPFLPALGLVLIAEKLGVPAFPA
jgi:sterol 3beta-glucosyltransferase